MNYLFQGNICLQAVKMSLSCGHENALHPGVNAMDLLTADTALAYVKAFITDSTYPGFHPLYVELSMDADEALDVHFEYEEANGEMLPGCMTVWVETNGKLCGEW